MTDKWVDEYAQHCRLHSLRTAARSIELEQQRNNERFIQNQRRLEELNRAIERVREELRWRLFVRYCNTPCWRYRVV